MSRRREAGIKSMADLIRVRPTFSPEQERSELQKPHLHSNLVPPVWEKKNLFPSHYGSATYQQSRKPFKDITKSLEPSSNNSWAPWLANDNTYCQYPENMAIP